MKALSVANDVALAGKTIQLSKKMTSKQMQQWTLEEVEVTGTDFVQYVGNPCSDTFGAGSCEVCTGDCDQDADCKDALRCAQRSGSNEDVPGCVWADAARFDGTDFCKYLVLRFILGYCCVYS